MSGHLPPYMRPLLMDLHTGAELTAVQVLLAVEGAWPPKQRATVASYTDLDLMILGVT